MGNRELIPTSHSNPHQQACPICTGSGFHPYKLGLVQCNACSVVLSPAIWQPQANEQLEEEWFGEDYQPATSSWVTLFESWNNSKTLARLAQADPPGPRLLEVGVGSGTFLNAARERNYEVMGCDLSAPICARVSQTFGIGMHSEPLSTLSGDSRFDVIVMNHVLEHVHRPIEFMSDVRRLLAPGGVVHVAVPNIACWEAALRGWTSYEPYHLAYFDPQTLARTITAGGLVIERMATHDSFSGWFLAVLRTALGVNRASGAVTRQATNTAGRAASRRPGAVEHAYRFAMVCAGGGLWPLRWLQSSLGRGDETVCIASKPKTISAQSGFGE
jgi:2-polyprenyl-3-methyl-5-hydroxy-6-metoxy-1,4-benzoquinol methylase